MKKPFVTKEKIEEIVKTYPTPFHIYDEKGIRENARRLNKANLFIFFKTSCNSYFLTSFINYKTNNKNTNNC